MYKNILVPVDLNEKSFCDKAVEQATWIGERSQATLHLLTVVPGIHMSMVATYFPKDAAAKMKADVSQQLEEFAQTQVPSTMPYQTYVVEGKPYSTIIEYAKKLNVDLIVMPSHKRSKLDKVVLGSVASKVVEFSPISVMVVKPLES